MNPDFKSSLLPAPRTDNGVGCGLACGPEGSQIVPVYTHALAPRGDYLRALRRALDMNLENGARVLKIGIAEFSGLETGSFIFAEASTWARVELALINSQGPAWCGWVATDKVWIAATLVVAVEWSRSTPVVSLDFYEAAKNIEFAAALQRQTLKRGILYRLAGELAIKAGQCGDAVGFAQTGLDAGDSIGILPPWLTEGLRSVILAAETEFGVEQA